MSQDERDFLLNKVRISKLGQALIASFENRYSNLDHLHLRWSNVSFSKYPQPTESDRRVASQENPNTETLSKEVCIYLTHDLPQIEHVADLSHELAHATRLPYSVLVGEGIEESEFVRKRIAAEGGEADAFATECEVKRDILKKWDALCTPYVSLSDTTKIDVERVVKDLYNGALSASLTGETYPTLLSRQYRAAKSQSLN